MLIRCISKTNVVAILYYLCRRKPFALLISNLTNVNNDVGEHYTVSLGA